MPHKTPKTPDYGVGRHLVVAALLAGLLLFGAGGWAATARLNAAIIGSGLVKVDREVKTVQHLDGGRVAEIHVAPGQEVAAGDVLLTLDTFDTGGELDLRRQNRIDLMAQVARLRAARDGAADLILPADLRGDTRAERAFAEEAALLRQARQDQATEQAALRARIEQLGHELDALAAREVALTSQTDLARRNAERARELAAKGNIAAAQQDNALSEEARLQGELDETRARQRAMQAQRQELELDLTRRADAVALQAQEQLRAAEPQISALEQEIALLEGRLERARVRAPVAGVVNEMAVNTLGQVIAPGQKLATVVPKGADLVIEFQIAPTDIEQIAVGKPARLRLSAFDAKTTPELDGIVSHVAAAATTDPATGGVHFIAQAKPAPGVVLPANVTLVPGMPIEVFVTTAERTALEYLLQPVAKSFARAMTEE